MIVLRCLFFLKFEFDCLKFWIAFPPPHAVPFNVFNRNYDYQGDI